jgi:hypothetical protein
VTFAYLTVKRTVERMGIVSVTFATDPLEGIVNVGLVVETAVPFAAVIV